MNTVSHSRPSFFSIQARMTLAVLSTVAVIIIIGFSIIVDRDIIRLRDSLIHEARAYVELLSQDFVRISQLGKADLAADVTQRLRRRPMIRTLMLFDQRGQPVYAYRFEGGPVPDHHLTVTDSNPRQVLVDRSEDAMLLRFPVEYLGENYGHVLMDVSTELMQAQQRRYITQGVVIFVALLSSALMLLLLFRKYFSQPIGKLVAVLEETSRTRDFSTRLEVDQSDEIGALYEGFNTLLEATDKSTRELLDQKYALDQHNIVAITDLQGTITYVNDKFVEISGYSRQQLLGENHRLLNSGLHPRRFFEEMYQVISSGKVWHGEIRNRRSDGRLYWLDTSIIPLKGRDGLPHSYISLRSDITHQKEAERALLASEQRYDMAMSVINDGIWDWHIKEKTVFYDPRYYTMAGYRPNEFPHQFEEFQKRVHPDDIGHVLSQTQAHLADETETFDVEFRFRCKSGDYIWIRGRGKIVERDAEGNPLRFIGTHSDITLRKQAEQALMKSEALFRSLVETTATVIWEMDLDSREFVYMSPQIEKLTGYDIACWKDFDAWSGHLHPDDREKTVSSCLQSTAEGRDHVLEYRMQNAEGKTIWVRDEVTVIHEQGKPVFLRGVFVDITELKQTELALRRSQKMDAIGQLTGGIAHDFNNILGIIQGNLDLLETHPDDDEKVRKRIANIRHSAQRAIDLTRQLLSFSRRDAESISTVNINQLVENMHGLLSRSLTPQIHLELRFDDALWLADIDTGSFEDALVNLVLNARDAMSGKGNLIIETANCQLDEQYCQQNPGTVPGDYVELAISDDGEGIPQDIQERILEPFFTTKEQGKGTGLGLAMVFGFVKRSNGSLRIYSEEGIGTTIRLYFPRSRRPQADETLPEVVSGTLPTGDEVLLVVDDEQALLDVASETLRTLGYRVYTASSAADALIILRHEFIDLLFSDVVMPGMNGYELAEKAVAIRENLHVLLTSGYTEKAIAKNGQARFQASLLSKPYTQVALANRIRQLLDE